MGLQRMRWLEGIIDSVDMNLSKFQDIMKDRGVWWAIAHGLQKVRQQELTHLLKELATEQQLAHLWVY